MKRAEFRFNHFILRASLVIFSYIAGITLLRAEVYFGVFTGYQAASRSTNVRATEDVGYSTSTPLLHPSTGSDLELKDSVVGGIKLGMFFDSSPNWGVEFSSQFSRPDLKRQNVTITLTDGYTIPGTSFSTFTEDTLPADFNFIKTQGMLLYRVFLGDKWRPYLGVGPVFYTLFIHGDGRSGNVVAPAALSSGGTYNNGTLGDGFGTGFGVAGKLGVEYVLDKTWSLDFEYQTTKGSLSIDHLRSFSDIKADFSDQTVAVGLRYKF